MKLRALDPVSDFDRIRSWTADERSHAMWCANRFRYPLDKNDFLSVLSGMEKRTGDLPLVAVTDENKPVGFLCCSLNRDSGEGKLKFVIVDPEYRGKGTAVEMLRIAVSHIFEDPAAESVSLIVFAENPRARKCYEKAGFAGRKTDSPPFTYGEESWSRCSMAIERQSVLPDPE